MKAYIYAVQYVSEAANFEVVIERGIKFAENYTEITKDIENERSTKSEPIVDLYVVAMEKSETIHLSEESYEKILNGESL